jgi:erythromycin esterase-like protein
MAAVIQHASLEDWVARDAISCSLDSGASLNAGMDQLVASLDKSVELLGLGEPTHLVEAFLQFRNRVFQHLVEAHGFRAIALESSFPRGCLANEYVLGQRQGGATAIDDVLERGFSHGFGRMAANRALVEWMRAYNASATEGEKLRIYGFDGPMEMMYADSPRQMLDIVLDYLAGVDGESARRHRERIGGLVGEDSAWENQAAAMDPSKSIGLSPQATSLRIAVEGLATELWTRRPEFIAATGKERYAEAAQYASAARRQLVYHAAMAGTTDKRLVECLGIRDAMMAENLAYILECERSRPSTRSGQGGRVLAFAHNMHLQCGKAHWQWGPNLMKWWPAGAHVRQMLGPRYAVIGVSVGESDEIGLARVEAGTLEGKLSGGPGTVRLAPTHFVRGVLAEQMTALATRSASTKTAYFPFTSQSLTDFDWLAVLN